MILSQEVTITMRFSLILITIDLQWVNLLINIMSLILLVPDLLIEISLSLTLQDLKNFILICRKTHQSCSSDLFWKLKYNKDYPLYAPQVTCNHRLAYKFLSILPSLSFSDDLRGNFLCEFDVDKTSHHIKMGLDTSLIYPIPGFEVNWNKECESELHLMKPDINITILVPRSQNAFEVRRYPRSPICGKIVPVSGHLILERYNTDLLRSFLSEAKEKGYVMIPSSSSYESCISRIDVAKHCDIFDLISWDEERSSWNSTKEKLLSHWGVF